MYMCSHIHMCVRVYVIYCMYICTACVLFKRKPRRPQDETGHGNQLEEQFHFSLLQQICVQGWVRMLAKGDSHLGGRIRSSSDIRGMVMHQQGLSPHSSTEKLVTPLRVPEERWGKGKVQ